MRIISGTFSSRTIRAPASSSTRPTTDRARETLFNILQNLVDLNGLNILDLFAGSGALAIEAISRGAERATLVENDRAAQSCIEQNTTSLQLQSRIQIVKKDVYRFLKGVPTNFDLIFADAPYHDLRALNELPALVAKGWLASDGILIIEHSSKHSVSVPEGIKIMRVIKSGETGFTIMTQSADPDLVSDTISSEAS